MKAVCNKIILFILVIILFCLVLVFIDTLTKVDLSLSPIHKYPALVLRNSLYLVSYADGPEVFFKNRNILAYSAINNGIDFIYNYRKEHLDKEFLSKNPILNERVGAGWWLWKPYIILKTLESIPENSLLLYADSGLLIRQPIREFIDKQFLNHNKSVVLFAYDPKIYFFAGATATGDTFHYLGCNNDRCRYGHHVWAGLLIIKNNKSSRKFISDWLHACCNENLLKGSDLKYSNYPEFKYHQHDESILSVLGNRDADIVQFVNIDNYFHELFYMHRRKSDREDMSLIGFTNMRLMRFERKLLNRPILKQLREIITNFFNN